MRAQKRTYGALRRRIDKGLRGVFQLTERGRQKRFGLEKRLQLVRGHQGIARGTRARVTSNDRCAVYV